MKCMTFLVSAAFATIFAGAPAQAAQFFSAHLCQPYRNGATPAIDSYYQNQGSILAAANTTFSCPLSGANLNGNLTVRVYVAASNVAGANVIQCRLWKISASNLTMPGTMKSFNGPSETAALDVVSHPGPANTIGANVECIMKAGTKILGYYLY